MTDVMEQCREHLHAAQQEAMERANVTGVLSQRELDTVAVLAVLQSLRDSEPTEEMVKAGEGSIFDSVAMWRAMLTAALGESAK